MFQQLSRNDFYASSDILVTQQNTLRQKCVWSHNKTLSIMITGKWKSTKISFLQQSSLLEIKFIFQTTNLKFGNWLEFSISAGKMNHFWQMAKFEFVVAKVDYHLTILQIDRSNKKSKKKKSFKISIEQSKPWPSLWTRNEKLKSKHFCDFCF